MSSAEEFALYLQMSKPYIIKLETMVQKCPYGELDLRLSIRAGVVEKMTIITSETWLKKENKQAEEMTAGLNL